MSGSVLSAAATMEPIRIDWRPYIQTAGLPEMAGLTFAVCAISNGAPDDPLAQRPSRGAAENETPIAFVRPVFPHESSCLADMLSMFLPALKG